MRSSPQRTMRLETGENTRPRPATNRTARLVKREMDSGDRRSEVTRWNDLSDVMTPPTTDERSECTQAANIPRCHIITKHTAM